MSEQQNNNQVYNMDSTLSLAALSAMSIDDKTSGQTDMAHINAKTNNSPANSHLSSGSALANNSNNGQQIIEGSLTKLQQQHNDDGQQQQYQQQFDSQQQATQHLQNQPVQQFDQQPQQFQQQQQQYYYDNQPQHIQQQCQYIDLNQPPQYEPLTLPIITPEDLPPDMLEAFNSLEPNQQVQALEMLAQQQLLEMQQAQQQQIEHQNQLRIQQEQEEKMRLEGSNNRPEEHFLTIALNGTILGATEMVTGYNPTNLLMTSAFDNVHEDDLLGLHAIKTHFWERDQPDVEVYLRRRSISDNNGDGEWIWLIAKVVSYIDSPVPGIIIHESICYNVDVALLVSKVTRIASLLLQAVESSLYNNADTGDGSGDNKGNNNNNNNSSEDVYLADVAQSASGGMGIGGELGQQQLQNQQDDGIQALLSDAAKQMGVDLTDSDNPLRELMNAATAAADNNTAMGNDGMSSKAPALNTGDTDQTKSSSATNASKKNTNKVDQLDYLKSGACLDLSKIILTEGEVKLVTLVLTGRLQIEDLGPLLYLALNSPEMNLVAATDEFYHLSEVQLAQNQSTSREIGGAVEQSPTAEGGTISIPPLLLNPPPLSVINLSYTEIGDHGMEALSEFIYSDNATFKTLDLSFCNISSQGLLALCHGLKTRCARGLPQLQALALCGNTIKMDVARMLGKALSSDHKRKSGEISQLSTATSSSSASSAGLKLLHLGSTSISRLCLVELLSGLGSKCPLQDLKLQSNRIGPAGAATLVTFLDGKTDNGKPVLPKLNRLDMSYNELGDAGTTKLTRAISKRVKTGMKEVSLSGNDMGSKGIESIMNKLLQHKLVTLNLDNNSIGDQGCQLVAASLPTITSLSRLNLAFNDIGCRGMATLMRSLVGCESITSLGLSGNVMRISGAIAMGFTLAQHPRLSMLELDNCCLSQVAQCHIVAGIISNRWVPMKVMHGFRAGPPMVAIGALEIAAQHMTNEVCFQLRRDIQMKTLLQWMENNRNNKKAGGNPDDVLGPNDASGVPSQSAYLRMLDWLGRIPFDESELMDLRKYFYDISGGDGDQKSESNLKHRGDILAALASDVVEEILESEPIVQYADNSVGLDLFKLDGSDRDAAASTDMQEEGAPQQQQEQKLSADCLPQTPEEMGEMFGKRIQVLGTPTHSSNGSMRSKGSSRGSLSTMTMSMARSRNFSRSTQGGSSNSLSRLESLQFKARITMFPQFAAKLDNLKAVAQEMMDNENDPTQQDVIAQQFAEASLTILRQLRYHCMESGLDGWRQGKLRRKVLIVDDSIVTRKLVARAFEKANFIVDTAEDGVKGVNKMKDTIYDIAFMDIDMPVMNGFDATKAFRMWEDSVRPGARQPICALTAARVEDFDRNELMKFKEAGLDVMESKPCNIPRLFKVVDDVSPMFSDLSINASQFEEPGAMS